MNTSGELREMSRRERRDALEDLVVSCVRELLLMEDGEELPLDQGYFDLGLTSLRLNDMRAHLERVLDVGIDATVLFGLPTVDRLVAHLTDQLSTERADHELPNRETSDVG
ncbi:acyl carrier protein [Embleya sp. AB8]|uniref:acyl carrier protein n=1 Tax=Embleya sp. AB8 TaxID=3156304 RepID=UPI003C752CBB